MNWNRVLRAGLSGPGIESWWVRDSSHQSRRALRSTHPSVKWMPDLFQGGKVAGTWRWSHIPSIAEVKEGVWLYLYSPCVPSRPVLGWKVPLTFISVILSLVSSVIRCVFICMLSHFRLYKRYIFWPVSGKCPLQTPAFSLTILIAVYRGFLRRTRQMQKQRPTLSQTRFLLRPYPIFRTLIISSSWRFFPGTADWTRSA
jgi:hypothetical protein